MPEPSTYNLAEVFNGGWRYTIPTYQRGYAWTSDQIDDFLEDLKSAKDSDDKHFFGFMLTVSKNNDPSIKLRKIIDGQQRLSTVMLFLICARNYFKRKSGTNTQKYQNVLESILRRSEYETTPTFALGKINQELFKEILMRDDDSVDKILNTLSATSDSNEKLVAAYKQIREAIGEKDIKLVQDDLNTLFEKFIIILYEFEEEEKAYNMFNLINNRGIRLTESDHIKNYLFGELEKTHNNAIDKYDKIWNEMRKTVTGSQNASYKNLDLFLHHYLLATGAHKELDPKLKHMFKTFRLINTKQLPGKTISELQDYSKTLKILRIPKPANFNQNETIVYYLKTIRKIGAIYVYPLLLIAYEKYWKGGYDILFELVVMLCLRYHMRAKVIAKIPTSVYERQLRKLAQSISADLSASKLSSSIYDLTQQNYPTTDQVFNALEHMRVPTARIAIALLQEVEYAIAKKRHLDLTMAKKRRSEFVTREHIMPEKINAWKDYILTHNKKHLRKGKLPAENIDTIHQDNLHYLGNQTLLSNENNKIARNNTFKKKKGCYRQDPKYEITADLANNPIWNVNAILKRNREFARILCTELDLIMIARYLDNEYQNGIKPEKIL